MVGGITYQVSGRRVQTRGLEQLLQAGKFLGEWRSEEMKSETDILILIGNWGTFIQQEGIT